MSRFILLLMALSAPLYAMENIDFQLSRKLMRNYNSLGYQIWLNEQKSLHSPYNLAKFISYLMNKEMKALADCIHYAAQEINKRTADGKAPFEIDELFQVNVEYPLQIGVIEIQSIAMKLEHLKQLKKEIESEQKLKEESLEVLARELKKKSKL